MPPCPPCYLWLCRPCPWPDAQKNRSHLRLRSASFFRFRCKEDLPSVGPPLVAGDVGERDPGDRRLEDESLGPIQPAGDGGLTNLINGFLTHVLTFFFRITSDTSLSDPLLGVRGSGDALWEPSADELGDYKQLFLRRGPSCPEWLES